MQTDFIYEMTVDKDPSFFLFFLIFVISSSHLSYTTEDFTTQERRLKGCFFNYGRFWSCGHLENTHLKHTFPVISESTGKSCHSIISTTSLMMYRTNILTFWYKMAFNLKSNFIDCILSILNTTT